jgi:hypothetical protein
MVGSGVHGYLRNKYNPHTYTLLSHEQKKTVIYLIKQLFYVIGKIQFYLYVLLIDWYLILTQNGTKETYTATVYSRLSGIMVDSGVHG